MAVDPVCGMEVDPAKAKYKTLYKARSTTSAPPCVRRSSRRGLNTTCNTGPRACHTTTDGG